MINNLKKTGSISKIKMILFQQKLPVFDYEKNYLFISILDLLRYFFLQKNCP
jgi:hypothetical protein